MVILKFISIFFLTSIIYSIPDANVKALWIVRDHMTNPDLIDEALGFAENNGFNHIFAQVRGRGDSFYNSEFVPKSILVDPNFDPLNYLINKCKSKNIKVHAWINVYYLWSSKKHPPQNDHLFFQRPEWIDQEKGDKYILNRSYLNKDKDILLDGEGFFLAPTNPDVKDYLINVISELSGNYHIDGIHYDYIRYHSLDYGYNEVGFSFFSEMNDSDDNYLKDNFNRIFSDFKRNAITEFVKIANTQIKINLPNCIISAAVKPNIYNAKLNYFQEWDLWLSAGYVDWAVPMNYATDNNDFIQNMYMIKDNLPKKYHDKIIVGISTYNQSPRSVGKKISKLKRMRFNNISIFSYNTMVEKPNYWRRLRKYLY